MMELIERQDVAINCDLVQVTPMLHFQHSEPEATLRPSEVKPKLDRYICHLLKKYDIEIPDTWYRDDKLGRRSLRYKMSIGMQMERIGDNDFDEMLGSAHDRWMKFLDTGDRDLPKPVFYRDSIPLSIIPTEPRKLKKVDGKEEFAKLEKIPKVDENKDCPVCLALEVNTCERHTLKDTIKAFLPYFFATHTFGSRQSKGYGSFVCSCNEKSGNKELVAELLPPDAIAAVTFTCTNTNAKFDEIAEELTQSFYAAIGKSSYVSGSEKDKKDYRANRVLVSSPVTSLQKGGAERRIKDKYPIFLDEKKNPHNLRRPSAMRFRFAPATTGDNGKTSLHGTVIFFNIPLSTIDKNRNPSDKTEFPTTGISENILKHFDIKNELLQWVKCFEETIKEEARKNQDYKKIYLAKIRNKRWHDNGQNRRKYDYSQLSGQYAEFCFIADKGMKREYTEKQAASLKEVKREAKNGKRNKKTQKGNSSYTSTTSNNEKGMTNNSLSKADNAALDLLKAQLLKNGGN